MCLFQGKCILTKKQRDVYQKVGHKRKSHESGLSHRESDLLYGVSSWTSSYALFWCRRTYSLASAYVSRQNLTGIRLILMQLKGSVVEFAFSRDGIFQKSSGRLFTAEASPMMRMAAPQTRVRV